MSLIESQAVTINKSDEEIFNFISDFTNFATLMPPQVQDVKITQDSCSFSIQGMPTINLKIYERTPFSSVKMKAEDGKLPFTLACSLESVNETQCIAQFHFEAELNPMMKMMVAKPLGNFLNLLSEKLKEIKS
jgi:carbon monoxide dehydrogenase subunit G